MLVGVIADTHGYFDPRIAEAFLGVESILHAGDIGRELVLRELETLARVTAVAGNNDGPLANLRLPSRANLIINGIAIHLVHRLQDARPPDGARVLVCGHSHRAEVEKREGILYVNPGAAGRVGFQRELTVALLHLQKAEPTAEIVTLGPRLPRSVRPTNGRSRAE
jgi:uncharacterized protein